MLPDMEGFDVARRLGAEPSRVPIVLLAARDAVRGVGSVLRSPRT